MPLLRRRGNVASDTDARQKTSHDAEGSASLSSQPEPAEQDNGTHNQDHSRASLQTRPETPPVQERTARHHRFSILRFRNASDSQLSLRARQQAEKPPPIPRPPEIITTAPTDDFTGPKKKTSRMSLATKLRRSHEIPRDDENALVRPSGFGNRRGQSEILEESPVKKPTRESTIGSNKTTPAAVNRPSESSRSDASSNGHQSYSSPITTPKKSPATNPFFRFRRSKKPPEPLFPLSHLPQKNKAPTVGESSTSLAPAPDHRPSSVHSGNIVLRPQTNGTEAPQRHSGTPAITYPNQGGPPRSGQSSPTRTNLLRGRSSTMSSMKRDSTDDHLLPPTTRTSSSTGRKSFGDLFGLSRLRQNSELSRHGTLTPATPGSTGSKSNSFQLARDSITLPERREDESPAKFLARVEEILNRGVIAALLSKGTDPFSMAVLRSYMRSFSFFGDPMDMAIRKLLMQAELPKETQQIDRCLQAFSNRYHECNPGIYASPDQAYFIAFSLLILHTDVFNKNNKYKMQKADYLKNTRGEGIFDEVLECFYDNITYTPFIHVEDEIDFTNERNANRSKRKPILAAAASDPARRAAKEPIDPYTLIMDGNLDVLRPNLKDAMHLEEHYSYLGTATNLNLRDLQKTFFRTGVLQIVSARSRPDAFMSDKTVTNPNEAPQGIVDIKITKVGLLWRKDAKRRKTRSPWQEWGAILTGAQLYLFRNTSWVKNLMHQHDSHIKQGNDGIPVIFKPPLDEFKPDALMSTQGAVALLDQEYKKHKNAFVYVKQSGMEEVLLADNEEELNDWLAKLNYAAAFRTSGVRMRGVTGGHYDGQGRRGMRRLDSSEATQLIDTPTGQVSIARGRIDHKMAEDIQTARREYTLQKIEEAEEKLKVSQKKLDEQLQNGRHLQVLAPIQPRSREHLLSSAAKMSAQLKWTRMEIWREKCHRDILKLDLDEDSPIVSPASTPVKSVPSLSSPGITASLVPQTLAGRIESNAKDSDKASHIPADLQLGRKSTLEELRDELESPLDQIFETPPQSATNLADTLFLPPRSRSRSPIGSIRDSFSSVTTSPVRSTDSVQLQTLPQKDGNDFVDADEHHFLHQAGLLKTQGGSSIADKAPVSSPPDGSDQGVSDKGDKVDKSKIRRSLHRTLREGAGHLSHHRSKRSREITPIGSTEDSGPDSMLARGTGSFTVHGKKASVINIGTELQKMSNEEKLRPRRQSQAVEQPLSPAVSVGDDAEFYAARDAPVIEEFDAEQERRESAASASTATARSFRELHRKYSTAQAVRTTSVNGRLAIPSDGESEVAVSFIDGRRSPLPPIDTEGEDNDDEEAVSPRNKSHDGDMEKSIRDSTKQWQGVREKRGEQATGPRHDLERIASPPAQAVNV